MEELYIKLMTLRYKLKLKKLNISIPFFEAVIHRQENKDAREIFNIIKKSKTKEEFKNRIIEFLKNNNRSFFTKDLLLGSITGRFSFIALGTYQLDKTITNDILGSFINDKIKQNIMGFAHEYVMNNNEYKNAFAPLKRDVKDLRVDLSKEEVEKTIEDIFEGRVDSVTVVEKNKYKVIEDYILRVFSNYSLDDIENNFDFIKKDILASLPLSLNERRSLYEKNKNLNIVQKRRIYDVNLLLEKLNTINNSKAQELIKRLLAIKDNLEENYEELDDIYLEFEIILREELVDKIYTPVFNGDKIVITNYDDIKPALLHIFLRDSLRFKESLMNRIKDEIISMRTDGNKSLTLSPKEQKDYERRLTLVDAMIDPTVANFSFEDMSMYTDNTALQRYISDTSNQISTTLFDKDSFLDRRLIGRIGIGFDKKGLDPRGIILSSTTYLTTNRGIGNIEYSNEEEFNILSNTYKELLKAGNSSEILLFRRNIDFDTKASYIFAIIDSSDPKGSEKTLQRLDELNKNSKLKVVIYDNYQIRKSYEDKMKEEESLRSK